MQTLTVLLEKSRKSKKCIIQLSFRVFIRAHIYNIITSFFPETAMALEITYVVALSYGTVLLADRLTS